MAARVAVDVCGNFDIKSVNHDIGTIILRIEGQNFED
jgi:hypothetical protein